MAAGNGQMFRITREKLQIHVILLIITDKTPNFTLSVITMVDSFEKRRSKNEKQLEQKKRALSSICPH